MFYRLSLLLTMLSVGLHSSCERKVIPSAAPTKDALRVAYERPTNQWPSPTLDSGVVHHELGILRKENLVPPPAGEARDQVIDEKALVALGKQLFFDPVLSASNQVSCGSCHDPDLAWGDGRRRSFGHDRARGQRNAPSLLNAGHWTSLFWDGRAQNLEEQVLAPLQDVTEMNQSLATIGDELSAHKDYVEAFRKAFGVATIDVEKVTVALAAFERGLRSRPSQFDKFVSGRHEALTDQQIRGLHLFRTKARCMNCHNGPLLSDQLFHNQGSHLLGRSEEDLGRYLLTDNWVDAGKFRTPMLRDITFTGPYFHHGNISELREILNMYNAGMPQVIPKNVLKKVDRIPIHDPLLQPLGLTDTEIDDLLAFLGSISTRPRPIRIPEPISVRK
ncbi:MAG: cytochrome c peroxidase [Neolewinella sp.]|jgi:cytochrome c peroxidase